MKLIKKIYKSNYKPLFIALLTVLLMLFSFAINKQAYFFAFADIYLLFFIADQHLQFKKQMRLNTNLNKKTYDK